MISEGTRQALRQFQQTSAEEIGHFIPSITPESLEPAAELILQAQKNGGRVHITGIGKPSHVAAYMASLLSSTGTPTYFLHGTEAVHGSCGQLVAGDVVICISNSGETAELKATVTAIKNNDCRVIAVTGNPESWLAKNAGATLLANVTQEGGPLNRAPRASILAEMYVLQALCVYLQTIRGLTPQEYVRWHPGGTLGQLRDGEK